MTHEQKITYMATAANICGFGFTKEHMDLLVSMYELVIKKEGQTNLHDVAKIEADVLSRYPKTEASKPASKDVQVTAVPTDGNSL